MTSWQAKEELKNVFGKWFDFDYWAYLQLEMRGEWSQERMAQVLKNHRMAEQKKQECKDNIYSNMEEMKKTGVSDEEINAYHRKAWENEYCKYLAAWRSLDGLSTNIV